MLALSKRLSKFGKAADLKNQEAIVVKVNAFAFQQLSDLCEVALLLINVVVRAVVAMRCA